MSEELKRKLSESHKGQIPWSLGKKMSDEFKRKVSLHNQARRPDVLERNRRWHLGRKLSNETKKKVGENSKKLWQNIDYRNKKYMDILFGKHLRSQESINKFVATRTKNNSWNKKGMHSPETIEICRQARLHQVFPAKDSKPEKMLQIALSLEKIPFEKHYPIYGQPDIFVKPNLCIFVDGCYFHGCQKCYSKNYTDMIPTKNLRKDSLVNHELFRLGYQVIRIWEHDIINHDRIVVHNIIDLIKHIYYSCNTSEI